MLATASYITVPFLQLIVVFRRNSDNIKLNLQRGSILQIHWDKGASPAIKENRSRKQQQRQHLHTYSMVLVDWKSNEKRIIIIIRKSNIYRNRIQNQMKTRQNKTKRKEEKETAKHYKITWRLVRQLCLNKVFCCNVESTICELSLCVYKWWIFFFVFTRNVVSA